MIDQLEQLSFALSSISRDEAKRVADAVSNKVMDLVNPQVIKLYWIGEAQDGVLLTPMAFINNTQDDPPRPFQITPDHKGILPWVFQTRKPLWLENIKTKDLKQPMRNEAGGGEVPPDYLDMSPSSWLDSMMVVPLTIRGDIRGLLSVELGTSGRLKRPVLELLSRLARPLAALFWDADIYTYSEERTSNAVSQFLNGIGTFSFDDVLLEGEERSGFIARPFEPDFSEVERSVVSLLESKSIRARAYQPQGGRGYIIDDIQRQIRNSHFCIADLTGLNPNVMAEVGMMMVLKKNFLLLRRRGDRATVPFDLNQIPLYDYELRDGQDGLQVWNVPDNRFQPFGVVLDRFIERLPPETGFFAAREWMPRAD